MGTKRFSIAMLALICSGAGLVNGCSESGNPAGASYDIVGPEFIPATTASPEQVRTQLQALTSNHFDQLRYLMAYITLTYNGAPYFNEKTYSPLGSPSFLDNYFHDTNFAREHLVGLCRMRSQAMALYAGELFGWKREYLGASGDLYREVSIFDTPVQLNHSALEIRVDDEWVFFDPTFGVYFTDEKGKPLGFRQARAQFPNIVLMMLDNDNGVANTHGETIDVTRIQNRKWKTFPGRYLLQNSEPTWYRGPTEWLSWENGDLLRLYFAVDAAPDVSRHYDRRRAGFTDPHTVYVDGGGFHMGLSVVLPEGRANRIRINGTGLGNVMFDLDYLEPLQLGYRDSVLVRRDNGIENSLDLQAFIPASGGILRIMPTLTGPASITGVTVLPYEPSSEPPAPVVADAPVNPLPLDGPHDPLGGVTNANSTPREEVARDIAPATGAAPATSTSSAALR